MNHYSVKQKNGDELTKPFYREGKTTRGRTIIISILELNLVASVE